MKRILKKALCLLICVITVLLSGFSIISAEQNCNWYIKKHKGAAPTFPKDVSEIKKYDVYYIDEKVND